MAGKPLRPTSGDPSTTASGGGGDARFLHDIEALSKALSLNPPSKSRLNTARRSLPPPPSSVRSTSEASTTNPKPSIWRSIKSLSHIGQRRFDCLFSLHVKSIDSLPTSLEGSFLSVHFHPSSSSSSPALATRPVMSSRGSAQFDETLNYRSSIYAKSSSSKTHAAKYEARQFSIHVTCGGADLGRHMVDLTRLLPLTIAELEAERDLQEEEEGEEKGKWSTSFRLTGRARGAKLNVSFGYCLVCEKQVTKAPPLMKLEQRDGLGLSREKRLGEILSEKLSKVERDRAAPNFVRDRARSRSIEDVRVLHEVKKPELPVLDFKTEIEKVKEHEKGGFEGVICKLQVEEETSPESKHCTEFTVIEQGVQVQRKDQEEIIDKTEGLVEKIDEDQTKDQEEINNKAKGLVEKIDEVETKDQEEIINKIDEVKSKEQEEIINKTEGSMDKSDEVEHENKDQEELITKTEGLVVKNDEAETKDQEEISTKTEELIENIEISNEVNLTAQESEENELKELESIFENLSFLESEEEFQSPDLDTKTLHKTLTHDDATNPSFNSETLIRSKSLDAQTESVASEFLTMLGLDFSPFGLSSDSDPESPREKLLRQFEQESGTLFGLDYEEDREDGVKIPVFPGPGFEIHPNPGIEIPVSKAKLMEDLETEALMREFGIDENSFLSSNEETGFGSPVQLPLESPVEFPPLGDNLGPFIQTKGGGFLRSMNPSNFKNARNGGNLVMQSSSPVVLPAEMGEGIMDILQTLASVGIEKLSVQASKLMPLEDFTGRNIEEIAWEADPSFDSGYERQGFLESTTSSHNPKPNASGSRKPKPRTPNTDSSDYVSLEDLAPSAMEKIEALSIEGLRIQSGMSDSAPPSNISAQSLNSVSALQGKGKGKGKEGSHNDSTLQGLQGTGCLQLLDIKGEDDDDDDVSAGGEGGEVDGLMGLSLSLNEWMRLDSGLIEEEGSGEVSERTARVLAAHKANSMDLVRDGPKKKGGRKWGLLGNNFTVAIMVQLRDPLRNYETVGTPMLALIQVERVFVPPKPKIYGNVIFKVSNDEINEDDENENKKENEIVKSEAIEEEVKVSQYKITEVHVAGFKNQETESGENRTKWGNNQELKSGSRWLLAAGMGKGNKNPLLKSKLSGNLKSGKGDSTLWSVSSKVSGSGSKFGRNANILLGKR
ncbi:hypothetical protein LUZ60_000391 [Juncus effusus]|nr:hypothetical protein LUZ60_000391 [Juncus effusus]